MMLESRPSSEQGLESAVNVAGPLITSSPRHPSLRLHREPRHRQILAKLGASSPTSEVIALFDSKLTASRFRK